MTCGLAEHLTQQADRAERAGESYRRTLVAEAKDGVDTGTLDSRVRMIAEAEAMARAFTRLAQVAEARGVEATRTQCATLLTEGADDTWSGRGNDVRRAAHDGTIDAVRRTLDFIQYGTYEEAA